MKTGVWMMSIMLGLLLGAGTRAQDWPQWRGPQRDNKVTGFIEPKSWPKELTKKWNVPVGVGESSPVLVGDRLYVFARKAGDEVTLCLDAKTGQEIWKDTFATAAIKGADGGFPGPRSTPAVADGKVCTLGVNGVVSCLDAVNGKVLWRKETKSNPKFHTSTSPLIADGKCIVYTAELSAYDLASGDVKWTWKGSGAPYGSPALMMVGGATQFVTPTQDFLAGIGLSDGKLLWEVKLPPGGYMSNYCTPLIKGDIVIYSVALKGSGSAMMAYRIEKKEDGLTATQVWKKNLAADKYQSPVLHDGLVFGLSTWRNLFCLDAKSGDELWVDKTRRGECGATLNAGSVMFSLTSDKNLVAFKPTSKSYEELAKYTVADAETWATPIISGNRVFVRDKAGALTLWTIE